MSNLGNYYGTGINELAVALCKAQSEMKGARALADNPFFKSKYADLESVWEAIREPFTKNGLCVLQPTSIIDGRLVVRTLLLHSSGQMIEGITPVKSKDESAQAMGSAISYARRYGLSSMCGVYQIDDDGEYAQGRENASIRNTNSEPDDRKPEPARAVEAKPANEQQAPKANNQAKEEVKEKRLGPSEPQLKRLYALKNKAKWTDDQVKSYMNEFMNVQSSGMLRADQYKHLTDMMDKGLSYLQAKDKGALF